MKALCINIDNGPEWELAKKQFDNIGMEVERFPAIVGDNRPLSFNQSVHAALSLMPTGGWLFEDDVMFDGSLQNVKDAIKRLPADFNTFHLGCNIIGTDQTVWRMPEPYMPGVARLWNCWQSHATYYSETAVQYILTHLDPNRLDEDNNIFDDWLRRKVLSDGLSFVINPMIAYQRPRHSAIWGDKWADYTGAHTLGNKMLSNI